MDQNNMYEQEIDLKDLLYAVLKKWRPVCLAAVLLAVLLGGYKLGTGLMKAGSAAISEEEIAAYESALESYELQKYTAEKQLSATMRLLETETERLETAPLMLLDPAEAVKLSYGMQVTLNNTSAWEDVQEDSGEKLQRVIDGYVAVLSDSWMDEAAQTLSMETKDLATVVSIRGDIYTHRFFIDVYAASKAEAEKILGAFTTMLGEKQDAMNAAYGDHIVAQVSERLTQDVNKELSDKQLAMINSVTSVKNSLLEFEKTLNSLKDGEPELPEVSKSSILKSGIKYGILGFVLGGFMAVFFVCVAYLMSDKVKRMQDITRRFGIRGLGEFSKTGKKRFLSGIDRWLDRLFGCGRMPEANEVYQIVAANVKNYMPEGAKRVLVTGSASEEAVAALAKQLSAAVNGVSFEASAGLAADYRTLEKLPGCDAVILAGEKGKTTTNDIEAELTILKNVGKPAVGIVLY